MTKRQFTRLVLGGIATVWLGSTVSTQSHIPAPFIAKNPEEIQPKEGSSAITIFGDQSKPGWYIVENHFAPGRGSRPHFHDQDRYVTVIKGTWWVALGSDADVYNPSNMIPMKPGSFVYHPAFGHHYDMAKDEDVVVRIMGMGPVKTTNIEQPK